MLRLFQSTVIPCYTLDVGDQYMLFTILTDFQYIIDLTLFPTSEWQPVHKRFPLSISSTFAFDYHGQRGRFQLTLSHDVSHKSDCVLTITCRRFLDVLALWSTSSVHSICNICRKNHISVAFNCDFILWLTLQLSHLAMFISCVISAFLPTRRHVSLCKTEEKSKRVVLQLFEIEWSVVSAQRCGLTITFVSCSGCVPVVDVVKLRAHQAHQGPEWVPQCRRPRDE